MPQTTTSATGSPSSTPGSTPSRPQAPSRSRTIPRPPPSPIRPSSPPVGIPGGGGGASGPTLAPGPGTPPPPSKPRARDLLRKHYGLGVGPPPPLQGPGKPLDPMDIDSPAFDAKSYYEQLITTSSLSTLLKKENELLSEIRQLDSERQSLVYNHHHELIAASDTISAMKTRAESIDADLEKLRMAFSEISRLNEELTVESGENDARRGNENDARRTNENDARRNDDLR